LRIGMHVIRGMYEHDVLLLAQMKHAAKSVSWWLVQTVPIYFAYSVGVTYNARLHEINIPVNRS